MNKLDYMSDIMNEIFKEEEELVQKELEYWTRADSDAETEDLKQC